jgi:hypothetical protein
MRPEGEITAATLVGQHLHYFALQEQLQQVREQVRMLTERLEAERRSGQGLASLTVGNMPRRNKLAMTLLADGGTHRNILREMAAAQDIHLYIEDLLADAVPRGGEVQEALQDLINVLAVLHLAAECVARKQPERVVVHVGSTDPSERKPRRPRDAASEGREAFEALFTFGSEQLLSTLNGCFNGFSWLESEELELDPDLDWGGRALLVHGLTAWPLVGYEQGTHLFCPVHGGLKLIQVHAWPIEEGSDPKEVLEGRLRQRQRWQQELAEGRAAAADDPLKLLPVLRIYNENGTTVDLRTGLMGWTIPPLYPFVVGTLPLPPELQ